MGGDLKTNAQMSAHIQPQGRTLTAPLATKEFSWIGWRPARGARPSQVLLPY